MRRSIFLAGVLPFVAAFLGGILAFSVVVPSLATAQSAVQQEVRANSFVLVDDGGTVRARLTIVPGAGVGALRFNRSDGTVLSAFNLGGMITYDPDGNVTMVAGVCTGDVACPGGLSSFDGVLLGAHGSVGMLPQ